MPSPVAIVAYLALFVGLGFAFLFVNLLVGRFVRPKTPNQEKLEIYECGEPTIGSSFVQFDLRFYVVALLFIIFDVEIAFFFPWATVFGKATQLTDPRLAVVSADGQQLSPEAISIFRELGFSHPTLPAVDVAALPLGSAALPVAETQAIQDFAQLIAKISMLDIAAFFAVLLVGFAYVWKRGDLDWVRAVSREKAARPTGIELEQEEMAGASG